MAKMKVSILCLILAWSLTHATFAGNPFLDAPNDQPVSAQFRGREWGENIPEDDIALSARVVTTRIAKTSWGAIFRIEFVDLQSNAKERREIRPDYYVVTDNRIALLNEANMEEAIQKLAAAEKAPDFEPGDIYGITSGRFSHKEEPWSTTIELKGDECIYLAQHPSGHFKKVVWKKGVGLVEYSAGQGAMADGYRLKRIPKKS